MGILKSKFYPVSFLYVLFILNYILTANIVFCDDTESYIQQLVAVNDKKDYRDVIGAYNHLKDMGQAAFPVLVKHLDDKRKSYGFFLEEEGCPEKCQYFVRDVCYEIILYILEKDIPKEYRVLENISKNEVISWIKEHQQLSLNAFRIKTDQYVLEFMRKENYNASIIGFWEKRLEARIISPYKPLLK